MSDGSTDNRSQSDAPPTSMGVQRPSAADTLRAVDLSIRREEASARVALRNAFSIAMEKMGNRSPMEATAEDWLLEDSVWAMVKDHFSKGIDYAGGKA